ncbi:MAG TPA: TerC family protein [Burkholderiales bacterium]|jgi:YjbE family integral membrane protein|nr:TerC family protein [Burkholderiales bacterium]
MEMLIHSAFWIGLGKIIWVNLLLSGDNAVVIALAARSLPPAQQKMAVFWGAGAAVIMRIILTIFAVALLTLPWLKIVGGVLLLWIGIKLLVPEDDGDDIASSDNLFQAIKTILIADLVMSLDNVLAVAAAADSAAPTAELAAMKYTLLVLGLAISIPIVIFGSTLMLKFMERWPVIITAGGALLGWIAGEMMVTDPAIDSWVEHNARWLEEMRVAAIAGAVLVVIVGMWLAKRQQQAHAAQAEPPKS